MSGVWNKNKWPNGKRKKERRDRKYERTIANNLHIQCLLNTLYRLDLSSERGYSIW